MTEILDGRDPFTGRPLRLTIVDGRITGIGEGPSDADGWLAPGLVDLQVNGYAGHDLNAAGVDGETVAEVARALRRDGVTTFVPTLVTASHDRIAAALRAIAAARAADPALRHAIPYVHLEGPHISDEDGPRGAHDRPARA
jgi:N-acetylglucosamine-6-phosphate deacetylase